MVDPVKGSQAVIRCQRTNQNTGNLPHWGNKDNQGQGFNNQGDNTQVEHIWNYQQVELIREQEAKLKTQRKRQQANRFQNTTGNTQTQTLTTPSEQRKAGGEKPRREMSHARTHSRSIG